MFATSRPFPSNLDSLSIPFIPLSVESIVGTTEFLLERQFRRINKQLETVALQKAERQTRKSNITGTTNQRQGFSRSLRLFSRKLNGGWVRRLQNVFTRFSGRKVIPMTLRGSIRSDLPWEVQAARCRVHQSHGTNTNGGRVSELLQEMRISHGILCDTASHINSRYGPEVLVATAASFCKLVLFLYKFIRDIILEGEAPSLLTAAMTINCTLQLARILRVCYRCEQARCQIEKSKDLLLKLSDTAMAHDAKQEAKVFILQLACKRTQFSACGFFCLNLALIRPVMGAITTYVALLIQFQTYGLSFK
ncbi:gustatory receptor for sugar taste 43a-like [Cryptotermes secundus]|uniref:gustatory receptor for sugar taste 43a-like n=1 Tax=Cryptotermes secundus TaxID=105785 RepID=UPI001454BE2A|nr:gustatory receptor for sugar taste 43a-like [Cryptotermes secundus]